MQKRESNEIGERDDKGGRGEKEMVENLRGGKVFSKSLKSVL